MIILNLLKQNMNINKLYDHKLIENFWYKYWINNNLFKSIPNNKIPYTIAMPPPNITGVLHMGHVLNVTIHDVLIRLNRMKGHNVCLIPGIDHASISTEVKVMQSLKDKNIYKDIIGREKFIKYVYEWKEQYGNIILNQIKKLGVSCDWDRLCFTMDEKYYNDVQDAFIHLYNNKFIYQDYKMVYWDTKSLNTVSDEEIIQEPCVNKLYYIKYNLLHSNKYIIVATSRPETIIGDVAICTFIDNKIYPTIKDNYALIPLINTKIPIICDHSISSKFGSGYVKITPAHDFNDYEIAKRHNLPVKNILNKNGTLNDTYEPLNGLNRFIARKTIVDLLIKNGHIIKIENYKTFKKISKRTNTIVEPMITKQWFVKMKYLSSLCSTLLDNNRITIYPQKYVNVYKNWLNNIQDWCISRQLWWGHRIPIWYLKNQKKFIVAAKNSHQAINLFKIQYNIDVNENNIEQDKDVLDTWFSSWLWPIKIFSKKDFQYYYPTNIIITSPEILFFWIIRMIIAGLYFCQEVPFKKIYITGTVRDKRGKKMSKSLGNSPDINKLIEKYGADSIRASIFFLSKNNNDIMFEESYCLQAYSFINKIWNSVILIESLKSDKKDEYHIDSLKIIHWFNSKINKTIIDLNQIYQNDNDLSKSFVLLYKIYKEDFCSFYLEIIKFYTKKQYRYYTITIKYLKILLKMLHPYIPFITEEIWHKIGDNKNLLNPLITSNYPQSYSNINNAIINDMKNVYDLLNKLRNFKIKYNISSNDRLDINIKSLNIIFYKKYISIIKIFIQNINNVFYNDDSKKYNECLMIKNDKIYIDLSKKNKIDNIKNIDFLYKKINILIKYKESIKKKLSNELFLKKAPDNIIIKEKKKYSDISEKINHYQLQIDND
ncbi:MAG: valine--tRNA ligase [Bacteroides sp.]|nr:MAG: valine--tRNA ligase [Bacteroides sp.]